MDLTEKIKSVDRVYTFGEMLFDHFEAGKRVGGAPFNVAYYLTQLDVEAHVISAVGTDDDGAELIEKMEETGMPTGWVQEHPGHPTGKVNVNVDGKGVPKFEVVENVAFDYISQIPPDLDDSILYYGTLAQRSQPSRMALDRLIKKASATTIKFCDLNLREPYYDKDVVEESLASADVVKLNEDELRECAQYFKLDEKGGEQTARELLKRFDMGLLLLTKGENGAALYTSSGDSFESGSAKPKQVVDTVGAGDSVAAMFISDWLKGRPFDEGIKRSVELATRVCEYSGCIVEPDELKTFLEP